MSSSLLMNLIHNLCYRNPWARSPLQWTCGQTQTLLHSWLLQPIGLKQSSKKTRNGPQKILNMRADLVGFDHMPGNHTGKHLAHAFLFITDRLDITEKVSSLLFVLICLILACQDWVDYYGQCIKQ